MKPYTYLTFFILLSNNLKLIKCNNHTASEKFKTVFSWDYINFTWPSPLVYEQALKSGKYVPKYNAISGIKFYKNRFYFAMPRNRVETPATFGYISTEGGVTHNKLITPYPSWDKNKLNNCENLQSVQSMEIDSSGIVWILDGTRRIFTNCPAKLVLLDLNKKGSHIHTYTFSNELCSQKGGFLNDIVIDETDGTYAYMTETSAVDPGLIVYSKSKNKAWKLRDGSMFQEKTAFDFKIKGTTVKLTLAIDGIALSPYNKKERTVFYSALTAFSLYSMSTKILKNETLATLHHWRREINFVGKKQSQTDGMIADNDGNLYYTLLPLNAVGKWNINKPFDTSEILDKNDEEIIWPDSFTFDDTGNLYLLADSIYKYMIPNYNLNENSGIQFRVLKLNTGTKSYLSKK